MTDEGKNHMTAIYKMALEVIRDAANQATAETRYAKLLLCYTIADIALKEAYFIKPCPDEKCPHGHPDFDDCPDCRH